MLKPVETEPTGCVVCGAAGATIVARGKDYLHRVDDQEYSYTRCDGCGHLYLNPRPTVEEIARIYPPDYVTYTGRFGRPETAIARIKDRVLLGRFAALANRVAPTMRLLDIGCGDGRFLLALRRAYPKAKLTGLDWHFGPEILQELEAADIEAIVGAVETVELPEQHYDVIVMNQLIEHVWDVRLVLERCRRALRVGGLLAMETPNPDGWDRRFFAAGGWGGYYWPRHLNLFTRAHLTRLVEEAGMELCSAQSLLAPPCWIYSCQFSMQRLGFGEWVKRVFSDTSILLLAFFAVVDRIALALGAETSNQKLIARRTG